MTMTLIETKTLATTEASIVFSAIPGTYTDLQLVVSARANGGSYPSESAWSLTIGFNGSTTGFTARNLDGTGSGVASNTSARYVGWLTGGGATSNTFGNCFIYIPNYAGSTNKSFSGDGVNENNATAGYQRISAGLWSNTAAITSIELTVESGVGGSFIAGTTVSLYGILKGSGGATVS